MLPLHKPTVLGNEFEAHLNQANLTELIRGRQLAASCSRWLQDEIGMKNVLITKSCTHALELSAFINDTQAGDEIIMPSFGFVSIANAFAIRGAKCVFVDIRPDTLNIDEMAIEAAMSPRTKAVLTINYAGVSCEYNHIKALQQRYGFLLIEDNAHGILSTYYGQHLGTFGDLTTMSFDFIKNITCGEGGCLAVNNENLLDKARIHYEFGTNRAEFMQGKTNQYEWKALGSNYIISDLQAAILLAQLKQSPHIIDTFKKAWNHYYQQFQLLSSKGYIDLAHIPAHCQHNGHIFYIKVKDKLERSRLIQYLKDREIMAAFHYTPLHSSEFGLQAGVFIGTDQYTTKESERMLRLPLFYSITREEQARVVAAVYGFYGIED